MARVMLVVEDDLDIRMLVRIQFGADPAFEIDGEASDVATALTLSAQSHPDLIVLDHRLEGDVMGLDAAPDFKATNPGALIILFSASEELRERALDSPFVDAFLLKTQLERLVPLAKELLYLS